MGIRRLWSLLAGLPTDGALSRSVQGDVWPPGSAEHLLALLCEEIHTLTIVVAKANGDKKSHAPLRIPRPGDKQPEPEGESVSMSLADLYARG